MCWVYAKRSSVALVRVGRSMLVSVVASSLIFVSSSESPLPDESDSELRFAPTRRQCSAYEGS